MMTPWLIGYVCLAFMAGYALGFIAARQGERKRDPGPGYEDPAPAVIIVERRWPPKTGAKALAPHEGTLSKPLSDDQLAELARQIGTRRRR